MCKLIYNIITDGCTPINSNIGTDKAPIEFIVAPSDFQEYINLKHD